MPLLRRDIPGGLLTQLGGLLNANEELVIQSITAGVYFHFNETLSGTIDGNNTTFTLTSAPYPSGSVELKLNGLYLEQGAGKDFTISGNTITMAVAPEIGSILLVNYIVSPV